jgi:hypothetical protein
MSVEGVTSEPFEAMLVFLELPLWKVFEPMRSGWRLKRG